MTRSLTRTRPAVVQLFARFLPRLTVQRPAAFGPDTTADMPSDRLADIGLPQRTEANRRHSGQRGAIPQASLW